MQIANQSDIALFHISLFDCKPYISPSFFFSLSLILDRALFNTEGKKNQFIPENLHKILVSEDILKVGVNIGGMLQYMSLNLALNLLN